MYRIDVRALWMALALTLTIACGIQLSIPSTAQAQNLNNAPIVFDVRRNLPLEPGEEVYRDFYISAGSEAGFKKGMIIPIVRQISVHNPIINKQQANLNIPVGKLLVMHVERGISVAREESELTDEDRPTLEFEGIMIGDRIDLANAVLQSPDAKKKQKTRAPKSSATASEAEVAPAAEAVTRAKTMEPTEAGVEAAVSPAVAAPAPTSTAGAIPASAVPKAPRSASGSSSSAGVPGSPTVAVPVPAPQPAAGATNPPSSTTEKASPASKEPDIVRGVPEEGRGRVGESSRSGQSLFSYEGDGPRA